MMPTGERQRGRIDVEALKASADIAAVVGRYVKLKRTGKELEGLCPFHQERTPSFTVVPAKGIVHCFGCGAHHDVIGFLQRITGCSFAEACEQLGGESFRDARVEPASAAPEIPEGVWVPLTPVPADAPELLPEGSEWTVPVYNPKTGKIARRKPSRVFAYRNQAGELLGYVIRLDLKGEDGKPGKWTPQVTWCIGPNGLRLWCLQAFPEPRPLFGLEDLAAKPGAQVLLVEGEKCRVAGAGAWPQYAVLAWPGGSNGIHKVDWSPLEGCDVILWPDADKAGRKAMVGEVDYAGRIHVGIAQLLSRMRVRSLRMIDTEGMPKGWDIADALDPAGDNWAPKQLAAWAAGRVVHLNVVRA
jgi:hypothetical protein